MGMDHSVEDVTFGELAWHFVLSVLDQRNIQLLWVHTFPAAPKHLGKNSAAKHLLRRYGQTGDIWQMAFLLDIAVPVRVLILQTLELIQHGLQRSITDELDVLPSNHLLRCQTGRML